jgi:hypothetical protein
MRMSTCCSRRSISFIKIIWWTRPHHSLILDAIWRRFLIRIQNKRFLMLLYYPLILNLLKSLDLWPKITFLDENFRTSFSHLPNLHIKTLIHKDLDQSLILAQVSSTDLALCRLGKWRHNIINQKRLEGSSSKKFFHG